MPPLPQPESLRRPFAFGLPDLAVILGVLSLLAVVAHVGTEAMVSFRPPDVSPKVSLDPWMLPDYAARSTPLHPAPSHDGNHPLCQPSSPCEGLRHQWSA